MWISEMTAEILAWFCDIFTNADANPSEQLGSSLGATGFFFQCVFAYVEQQLLQILPNCSL